MKIKLFFALALSISSSSCALLNQFDSAAISGDRTSQINEYEMFYNKKHPEERHIEGAFEQHAYEEFFCSLPGAEC